MRLTVNGAKHDIAAPAHETLLTTLRDRLQLTGTKLVCGRGEMCEMGRCVPSTVRDAGTSTTDASIGGADVYDPRAG